MRIFVTGGTGVIGRRVVPLLIGQGHRVTALARTDAKAETLADQGAEPIVASLFDSEALGKAVIAHDGAINLATNIPVGRAAATRRGWRTNDRIRTEGSTTLVDAALAAGVSRLVQESIAFPYADGGADWITEDHPIEHHWGTRSVGVAEHNAQRLTDQGGTGVVLRFAMFVAGDSAHVHTLDTAARRGLFALPGAPGGYFTMVDADDAATAVVAALTAPPGVYNVAEDQPSTRAELSAAMAAAVGKRRLRRPPDAVARLGGEPARAMMRSQRVSNACLRHTTGWQPATPSVASQWEWYR